MSQRRLILTIAIVAFLAAILFPALIGLLTDWWWFQEIGYQAVFSRPLLTGLLLFVGVGGITFGVLYGNLRLAQRGLVPYPVVLRFAQNQPRVDLTGPLRRASLPLSLVIALIAGFGATPAWDLVLRFVYRNPFGTRDPVFSRDIGFYVFTLPGSVCCLGVPVDPRANLAADDCSGLRGSGRHPDSVRARVKHPGFGSSPQPESTSRLCWAPISLAGSPALAGGHFESALLHHRTAGGRQLHRSSRHASCSENSLRRVRHWRAGRHHRRRSTRAGALRLACDRRLLGHRDCRARAGPEFHAEVSGLSHRAHPGDALPSLPHRRRLGRPGDWTASRPAS